MSTPEFDTLQLVGHYVPDANGGPFATIAEANAAGHDTLTPTTGSYQIGVLYDGAFVSLIEEQASQFFALVAAAKAKLAASQPAPAAPVTPASVSPTTPQ